MLTLIKLLLHRLHSQNYHRSKINPHPLPEGIVASNSLNLRTQHTWSWRTYGRIQKHTVPVRLEFINITYHLCYNIFFYNKLASVARKEQVGLEERLDITACRHTGAKWSWWEMAAIPFSTVNATTVYKVLITARAVGPTPPPPRHSQYFFIFNIF